MRSRDALHQLVDDLPESEIPRAERVLQALTETADRPSYTLENAPEEAAAVAETRREHKGGKSKLQWITVERRVLPGVDLDSRDSLIERMEGRA